MTSEPKRSTGRWIAAIVVTVVVGAIGIFIAALPPISPATVITGFVIVIIAVVLGLLVAIRRPGAARGHEGGQVSATRRIRNAFYGSRSEDSDRMSSALRAKSLVPGGALLGPDPGPFDSPPEEDVELDPEHLPWELRDDASAEQSDRKRP